MSSTSLLLSAPSSSSMLPVQDLEKTPRASSSSSFESCLSTSPPAASTSMTSSASSALSYSTHFSSAASLITGSAESWHGKPRATTLVPASDYASQSLSSVTSTPGAAASHTVPTAYAVDGISLSGAKSAAKPSEIMTRTRRSKTLGDALVASRHARKASVTVTSSAAFAAVQQTAQTQLAPAITLPAPSPPPSCPPPTPVLASSRSSTPSSNRSRASSVSSSKSGRSIEEEGHDCGGRPKMAPRRRSSLHASAATHPYSALSGCCNSNTQLKVVKREGSSSSSLLKKSKALEAEVSTTVKTLDLGSKAEEDWSVFIKNGYAFPMPPGQHTLPRTMMAPSLSRTTSTDSSLSTATTASDVSSISSTTSSQIHAALSPGSDGTRFTLQEAQKSLEWLDDELAYPSSDEEDRLESRAERVRGPAAVAGEHKEQAAPPAVPPKSTVLYNRKKSNSLSSGTVTTAHGHAQNRWTANVAGRNRSGSSSSDRTHATAPLPASLLQIRAEHMSGLRGARSPSPLLDAMSDSRRSSGYTASTASSGRSARSRPSTSDSLASSVTSATSLSHHGRSDSDSSSKADVFTDASQTMRSPVKIPVLEDERLFSRLSMDSGSTDYEQSPPSWTEFKTAPQLPPLSHLQPLGTGKIDLSDRRNSFLQLSPPTIRRRASSLRKKDREEVPSSPSSASSLLASPPLGDFVAPQPPTTVYTSTTKAARAQLLGSWLESSSGGNKGISDSPVISPLRAHFASTEEGSQHPFTRSAMDVFASSLECEDDSDDDLPPQTPAKQAGLSRAAMNRLGISTENELLMPPPQLAFPRRPSMPSTPDVRSVNGFKKTLTSNKSMQELNPHRKVMTGRGGFGARLQVAFPQSHTDTDGSSPTERAFSVAPSSGSDTVSRASSVSRSSDADSKLTVESSPRPSFWRKLSNASRRDFPASEADAEITNSSGLLAVPAPASVGRSTGPGSWGFKRMRKTTLASNIFP